MARFTRNIIACLFLMVSIYLLSTIWTIWDEPSHQIKPPPQTKSSRRMTHSAPSPRCILTDLDPFHKSIRKYIRKMLPLTCERVDEAKITHQDGKWIRINRTTVKQIFKDQLEYCQYSRIDRIATDDDTIAFSDRYKFQKDTKAEDAFVRVQCYNKKGEIIETNFYAFIFPMPSTERQLRTRRFLEHQMKYKIDKHVNVIVVGVDAVSRSNSIRHLPKTREILLNNFSAVEFVHYNKVAHNTFVNLVPILAGKYVSELPYTPKTMRSKHFDGYHFIWKDFAAAGFATLLAEDYPSIATFNYHRRGFQNAPVDFYLRPFNLAMQKAKELWHNKEQCISWRSETKIVLDWVGDFILASNNTPFFALTWTARQSHHRINLVGTADTMYADFLKQLKVHGVLENTVVFFLSDHGMRSGGIRETYIGKMEDSLPMLFISLPDWFKSTYKSLVNNLYANSKQLITPFDIHETLKDLLYLNRSVEESTKNSITRGYSLFQQIPSERTCQDATISPDYCTCHSEESMQTDARIINRAANFAVGQINLLTLSMRGLCAGLELVAIHKASRSVFKTNLLDKKQESPIVDYKVTITTSPGGARFEATVRHLEADDRFAIAGIINRVNLYGKQSFCVDDFSLKEYCYCLQN